tara:strand:- start:2619 stop:3596 length:978 start_codon:yes stop_codon:yes gene_type:complete
MAGILDFITSKDPDSVERRLRLAQGLSGMSTNPNAGLQNSIQGRLEGIQAKRTSDAALGVASNQANATLAALKAAGVPDEVLVVAKANPALFKEIASSLVKSKMGGGDMLKFSGVQTDPTTGEQYTVMSDPNKGTSIKVPVAGASQQTPQQKIDMESSARLNEADVAKAAEVGQQAFGSMQNVAAMIGELSNAKKAIVEGGASTGLLQQYLPSFDNATSELRATANRLGIQVINSATFGALSEKELSLALSTGFPSGLNATQTVDWIDDKIAAQSKLYNELYSKARRLTSGITYSEFIKEHQVSNQPSGDVKSDIQKELDKRKGL